MKENPKNLGYTKQHEWVKVEGGVASVGITDFAQEQLTDIVFVDLPEKGKEAHQSKSIAVVESVKSVSDIFSPVSGQVLEVNTKLKDHPELINQDAFGEGWIFKIKIKDKKELDNLLTAEQYNDFIKNIKH